MAIHNATGVRFCRNQGMTRAVLARECSAAEIALAAKEGIEIEVFGHGAQCVAVSGECLFSSVVGGEAATAGAALSLAACCIPTAARPRRGSLRAMFVCATTCRS